MRMHIFYQNNLVWAAFGAFLCFNNEIQVLDYTRSERYVPSGRLHVFLGLLDVGLMISNHVVCIDQN